ncbi:hypothetical protein HDU86_000346 [Geranomyces michiganensis]|nr:hypothetical protein HDU86_000346 [Geranomyces michiganensis]
MSFTDQEKKNIALAKEYMQIAYTPGKASAKAVAHVCAPGNKFIAPGTFPNAHTLEEYAEGHAEIMESVNDLKIVSYDLEYAKGNQVTLRYTAAGSHSGKPHNGIPPSGKRAQWTAAALFEVDEEKGLLTKFVKDWDKHTMWKGLGWTDAEEMK